MEHSMTERKRLNALKHGTFTLMTILPGEDEKQFELLYSLLIEEWKPAGATEEDGVLSIAKGMWRKARLQKFLAGKAVACRLDPSHAAYDEVKALKGVSGALELAPDRLDEFLNRLSENAKRSLTEKFPAIEFETDSARAKAIKKEIDTVILPAWLRCEKPTVVSFAEAAEIITQDDFEREVALEERIDATIERAIKRLIQVKAMKQMLGQTSPKIEKLPIV
jgi:hypothetical protein